MNLTIGNLKQVISSTIGEDLKAEGFTVDKSVTWIKKTVNAKSKIHLFVDCSISHLSVWNFGLLLIFGFMKLISKWINIISF